MENQARENQMELAEKLLGEKIPISYRARLVQDSIEGVNSHLSLWEVFTAPESSDSMPKGCFFNDLIKGSDEVQG